jgi:hypothetical protein
MLKGLIIAKPGFEDLDKFNFNKFSKRTCERKKGPPKPGIQDTAQKMQFVRSK